MAKSINLGLTPFVVGVQQFSINGLPNNSTGFTFTLGRNATWLVAGRLFDMTVEIALDGVVFQPWITSGVDGGAVNDKFGQPLTVWSMTGTWPGQSDGSGGRQVLRSSDLRITITILRAFSAESVTMQTVTE